MKKIFLTLILTISSIYSYSQACIGCSFSQFGKENLNMELNFNLTQDNIYIYEYNKYYVELSIKDKEKDIIVKYLECFYEDTPEIKIEGYVLVDNYFDKKKSLFIPRDKNSKYSSVRYNVYNGLKCLIYE